MVMHLPVKQADAGSSPAPSAKTPQGMGLWGALK